MTLRFEREMIEVTSMSATKPDPAWRYTDRKGHEHQWVGDKTPTLVEVEGIGWWCEDCREQHSDYHLVCARCRERIEPKTFPDTGVKYVAGPTRYYLDDEPITKNEYDHLMEQARETTG